MSHGFARIKCKDCGHEYLLAFVLERSGNPAFAGQAPSLLPVLPSEARRGIRGMALRGCPQESATPSFHLQHPENSPSLLLGSLSHTRYGNRKLLAALSRCAWESLKIFMQIVGWMRRSASTKYANKGGTVPMQSGLVPPLQNYSAKDGRTSKNFPALDWLAAMCSHIPNRGEQMVRYYGYYSNVSRGKRKETGTWDDYIQS